MSAGDDKNVGTSPQTDPTEKLLKILDKIEVEQLALLKCKSLNTIHDIAKTAALRTLIHCKDAISAYREAVEYWQAKADGAISNELKALVVQMLLDKCLAK